MTTTRLDGPARAEGEPPLNGARDAVIQLDRVVKLFGRYVAVHEADFTIGRGEFFSLLGPSGCGKTTTLRMIAGFEQPTDGRILLEGQDVSRIPPYRRNVNTVFQHYALFPHMTVYDNVAFGPRCRKLEPAEVDRRVRALLAVVRLTDFAERRPAQLSGGQRQRVALGRAIVREPQVFLMDEPLSNLDAKLRVQTRSEIKRLQEQVRTTTIYVTHDQVEAMTMGDRVAVMSGGLLAQVGDPRTVYEHPANVFVAGFIGSPAMSFAEMSVNAQNGHRVFVRGEVRIELESVPDDGIPADVKVGVRPEHARLWREEEHLVGPVKGRVEYVEMLGRESLVGFSIADDTRLVAQAPSDVDLTPGDSAMFGIEPGRLYLFDRETETALGRV
jgi:ABC-type sugar transport system ATPase subunit